MKKKDIIIKIFENVQKIPYKVCKFDENKIDENIQHGDCRHKSVLLKRLLEEKGFKVKKIKVIFDWKDLPLPKDILGILKKSDTIWGHSSLLVEIRKKKILVDASWDPPLAKAVFPVTKKWNGASDTLPVSKGKTEILSLEEYKKRKKYIRLDPTEIKNFALALNNYLEKIRKSN